MSKAVKGFDICLKDGKDGESMVFDAIKEMIHLEVKTDANISLIIKDYSKNKTEEEEGLITDLEYLLILVLLV